MTSSSPPPLVPIYGYNHIHHTVVNPSMSNRQMESQVATSFDQQPYIVKKEFASNGVSDQEYDTHSFAQNEDSAKQLLVKYAEPEFNPLQRSNQEDDTTSDAEFFAGLLCHPFHPSQDSDHHGKRALNVEKIVADVDCYWYRRNLENVATIGCLKKKIRRLEKKLKTAENIRDVQFNATQFNAVEWKKKDKNTHPKIFHCKTCLKKYKTKRGLQLHTTIKHGKNQTDCQFTDTMTPLPDFQRKQSDSDHHGRYFENGLPVMSPQASLFLFPNVQLPSV